MTDRRRTGRAGLLLPAIALVSLACVAPVVADELPEFQGLALAEALELLESRGLRILYSSELVRPTMRVVEEPVAGDPREMLEEILFPHALAIQDGPGGSVLVVTGAARGKLRGIVRDRNSALPLANVQLIAEHGRIVTGADGTFRMLLAPGSHRVEARRAGYFPTRIDALEIVAAQVVDIVFELTPQSAYFEDVVVTADGQSATAPHTESRVSLGQAALRETPKIGDDALRVAELLPGANGSDESAAPNIRGGADDETLILLDGMELYEPYHLKDVRGFTSIIDSRSVGNLDYLNGGFPAEYGGRMSGVLDVTSRTASAAPSYGVGLSTENGWLRGEGRARDERLHWLASARAGFPKEPLERLGVDAEAGTDYYDMFAKVGFDVSPRGTLAMHFLVSRDELTGSTAQVGAEPGSESYASTYDSRYAWLGWRHNWSERLFSQTTLSFGRLWHDRDGAESEVVQVRDRRLTRIFGGKQDWIFVAGRHRFKGGADIKLLRAEYDYRSTPFDDRGMPDPDAGFVVKDRPRGTDLGLYLSDRIRLAQPLDLELGLRFDRQDYAAEPDSMVSPRVNVSYRTSEHGAFRAAWGHFFQPQRISELQAEDGVDRFFRAQRSEHLQLDYDHDLPGGVRLRLGAYHNRITHLRPRFENLFDPLGVLPEAADDRVMIAPDSAEAQGAEALLRSTEGRHWSWFAGYGLAAVDDRTDGVDVPRAWDQRHTAGAGVGCRIRRWKFDLLGSYHSGRPTTPLSAEQVDLPGGGTEIVVTPGARNSRRFPSYFRVDARVERQIVVGDSELQLWVQLLNALDRENVCCVEAVDVTILPDDSVTADAVERAGLTRYVGAGVAWTF